MATTQLHKPRAKSPIMIATQPTLPTVTAPISGYSPTRRIDAFVQSELEATKKLLAMQQSECIKFQEHVTILEGEIDAMKLMQANKQLELNQATRTIDQRNQTIASLREEVKSSYLDRTAFKTLEDQNKILLKKLEEKIAEIDKLQTEAAQYRDAELMIRQYSDDKIKGQLDMEIRLDMKIGTLQSALAHEQLICRNHKKEIAALKSLNADLHLQLRFVDEERSESLSRSRRTEYLTLQKLDSLRLELQKAKDEKSLTKESLTIAMNRGEVLEKRLDNSIHSVQAYQKTLDVIVGTVEDRNKVSFRQVKKLTKENEWLENNLTLTRRAVGTLVTKQQRLQNNIMHSKAQGLASSSSTALLSSTSPLSVSATLEKTMGIKAVTSGRPVTVPRNMQDNIMVNTIEDNDPLALALAGSNQLTNTIAAGKRVLLSRFMELMTDSYYISKSRESIPTSPLRRRLQIISSDATVDLSNCAIFNDELKEIIGYLRLLPINNIDIIDLRHNYITDQGLTLIVTWIISLSGQELMRSTPSPLIIDLQQNKISKDYLRMAGELIKRISRPEISLVVVHKDDGSLIVYGSTGQPHLPIDGASKTENISEKGSHIEGDGIAQQHAMIQLNV